jgi:hypothetical protein
MTTNTEVAPVAPVEPTTPTYTPWVLSEGEAFAVTITPNTTPFYVHDVDEDGDAVLGPWQKVFTKDQATELADKVYGARVVQARPDSRHAPSNSESNVNIWVYHNGHYEEREIHVGEPTRPWYDGMPGWFVAAMQRFSPNEDWGGDTGGDATDESRAHDVFRNKLGRQRWLDHWGWAGCGEHSVLVSEPYHLTSEEITDLVADCAQLGFKFEIFGESSYFPSLTVRIEIQPIERLVYTAPVKNFGPLRQAWEDKRTIVFKALIRQTSIDQIEHVAHVVEDKGSLSYTKFLRKAITAARKYVADLRDSGTGDVAALQKYKDLAETYLRWARKGTVVTLATREVFVALCSALVADKHLNGFTTSGVGVHCRESLDNYQIGRWKESGETPAHIAESKWQQNLHKQLWERYYAQWADDKGPEETL